MDKRLSEHEREGEWGRWESTFKWYGNVFLKHLLSVCACVCPSMPSSSRQKRTACTRLTESVVWLVLKAQSCCYRDAQTKDSAEWKANKLYDVKLHWQYEPDLSFNHEFSNIYGAMLEPGHWKNTPGSLSWPTTLTKESLHLQTSASWLNKTKQTKKRNKKPPREPWNNKTRKPWQT